MTSTPEAFLGQVRERIMALSESHDLLVNGDWRGAQSVNLSPSRSSCLRARPPSRWPGP